MTYDSVSYRLALANESMHLSLTLLAVRLGLRRVTIEERYLLKQRCDFVRERIKELDL